MNYDVPFLEPRIDRSKVFVMFHYTTFLHSGSSLIDALTAGGFANKGILTSNSTHDSRLPLVQAPTYILIHKPDVFTNGLHFKNMLPFEVSSLFVHLPPGSFLVNPGIDNEPDDYTKEVQLEALCRLQRAGARPHQPLSTIEPLARTALFFILRSRGHTVYQIDSLDSGNWKLKVLLIDSHYLLHRQRPTHPEKLPGTDKDKEHQRHRFRIRILWFKNIISHRTGSHFGYENNLVPIEEKNLWPFPNAAI